MSKDRIKRSGVRWGLYLALAGVSVLALWPHAESLAGGGQDRGTPPEECLDLPTTVLPNPGLTWGGGSPGTSGGGYAGDPTSSGDRPCYEGGDLAPGLVMISQDGKCYKCMKCEFSPTSGQPSAGFYDTLWRDCPDGYDLATIPSSRMTGGGSGHEGTAGRTWFTLWDPYIDQTGTGSGTEYRVVLGPDLVYSFDDQFDPLCDESDTDGVTLDDDEADMLTLTLKRGVSTVEYKFHDFTQSSYVKGQFYSYRTDKNQFYASAHSGGNITQINRRSYMDGVPYTTERIIIGGYTASNYRGYTYHEYDDGTGWKPTRRIDYAYNNDDELESVTYRAGYDGAGAASSTANWDDIVGKMVFRYDASHRLEMVLDTEAVAAAEADGLVVDLDTAGNNNDLKAHATRIYEYHDDDGGNKLWREGMVKSVKGEGCGGCGSASSELEVTWAENANAPTTGANRYKYWWRRSTEEQKDDGGAVYRRTTKYINRAGLQLCEIVESKSATYGEGGTLEHVAITFYEYEYDATDKIARLVKVYEPSAIEDYPTAASKVDLSTLDGHDDLLDDTSGIELYDDQGVVRVTAYWDATTATTAARGGVDGYVRYHKVQTGKNGTTKSVTLDETLYIKNDGGGEDVYQVAEVKRFLEATGAWASTVWEYTWHASSNDIETVKRYRFVNEFNTADPTPVPGTDPALETTVVKSEEGRDLWRKDERGLITYYVYDADSLVRTGMVVDPDTDETGVGEVFEGFIAADFPFGPNSGGKHLRTDTETDKYNRVVKVTGPETSADTDGTGGMDETVRPVRWTVYVDGYSDDKGTPATSDDEWKQNEIRTASGYLEGVTYHLVGGIGVRITERGEDSNGVHWSESYVTERDTTTGELTATENVSTRSRWSGWTRTKTVDGQTTERHAYVDIPGSGYGDPADEYLKTTTGYHLDGSVHYTEAPNGLRSYMFRDKKNVTGVGDVWETRRYSVYEDGSSDWQLAAPISVSWSDEDGRTVRGFLATVSGALSGAAAAHPTFTGDTLVERSRTKTTYDWRHRASERWSYFDLTDGAGHLDEDDDGTEGTHYVVSETLARDDQGRTLRTQDPSGDITGFVYDALGRTTETWAGTVATGATRENPGAGGSNNLVLVSRAFYDTNGSASAAADPTVDLIEAERLKPNLDGAAGNLDGSDDEFIGVTSVYDIFGRRTYSKPDVGPWSQFTYSDAGRVTEAISYKYNTNPATAANLLTKSETLYDGSGRVTESRDYEVNIGTGSTGKYIQSRVKYDDLGRQQRTLNAQGAGSYTEWDDAGRPVRQVLFKNYSVDGGGDFDGVAVTETVTAYLNSGGGAGRPYLRTTYQRDHDASGSGLLSGSIDSQDTYAATWYDQAGRVTHSAYYGNNGGTAITSESSNFRPNGDAGGSMTYASGPLDPNSSTNVMVSKTTYDDLGRGYLIESNDGIETRLYFDDAGRRTHVVENYDETKLDLTSGERDPDKPSSGRGLDVNRVTKYVYDNELGAVTKQIAVDPIRDGTTTDDDQVTEYVYSNQLDAKGTPTGGLQSNRLLRGIIYPDSDDTVTSNAFSDNGEYDRVELTYYSDGTLKTRKDQRGTELTNIYHDDGALEYQDATALGGSTDDDIRSIGYTYDDLRRVTKITQYDDVSTGTPTAVNEVANTFTHLGQLDIQHQEHDGTATLTGGSESLHVDYDYDTTTSANVFTKDARLTQMAHPGGTSGGSESVKYNYGSDGDITHELGVIQKITESDNEVLAAYEYIGVSTLATVTYDKTTTDIKLDHFGGTSGTYDGYDRFYRPKTMTWKGSGAASVDLAYGYDAAGRRAYREDVKADSVTINLDELDTRNAFGELTTWKFGDLDTNKAIPSPDDLQAWTLDQVGNWKVFASDNDGTTDTVAEDIQDRTINKANEITGIDPSLGGYPDWIDPDYDEAGNMTTLPQPGDPTDDYIATYDAWNRLVKLVDDTPNPEHAVAVYEYDGLGRRIRKDVYDAGTLDYSDHFYYSGWQAVEVRRDDDGGDDPDTDALEIFVYHPHYIDAVAVRYYDAGLNGNWVRHYYLYDAQFSVAAIVNDSGTTLERYRYTPYGKQIVMNSSFVDIGTTVYAQQRGFQGLRHDEESGLIENRRRMLDPLTGRFLQRDPLRYPDGMNSYAAYHVMYGGVDPNGLAATKAAPPLKISFLGLNPLGGASFEDGRGKIDKGADKTFTSRARSEAMDAIRQHFDVSKDGQLNADDCPPFDLRITGFSWGAWTALELAHEDLDDQFVVRIGLVDPIDTLRRSQRMKVTRTGPPGRQRTRREPVGPMFGSKPANAVFAINFYQTKGCTVGCIGDNDWYVSRSLDGFLNRDKSAEFKPDFAHLDIVDAYGAYVADQTFNKPSGLLDSARQLMEILAK